MTRSVIQEQGAPINVSVILDHPDFVVINKPEGISVHKDDQQKGLVTLVSEQLKCPTLYLVHRLDKMTSGLLILAKTEASNRILSQMFQARQVSKYYLALSNLKPKKKQGLVKGDMTKSRGGSWKLMPSLSNPAITQFFSYSLVDVLASNSRLRSPEIQSLVSGLRLFVLKPHTGKTHQLRVAMKSLASPILGDQRYYSELKKSSSTTPPDRGYLHAWRLNFHYQGEAFHLEAQPDRGRLFCEPDFQQYLSDLGDPELMSWPKI